MPRIRVLTAYPGEPYHSGEVVEVSSATALPLLEQGRAELLRELITESTITVPSERAVTYVAQPTRRRRATP